MASQGEDAARRRSANFTLRDKDRLLNIIYKYKDVVENKKTNALQNEQKNEAWSRIATEFNAGADSPRGVDQLKKYFNNQKKVLRKNAAEEKKDILLTGGGTSLHVPTQEDALLRSIVNEKTIDGFYNEFDGDRLEGFAEDISYDEPAPPQPTFTILPVVRQQKIEKESGMEATTSGQSPSKATTPAKVASGLVSHDELSSPQPPTSSLRFMHPREIENDAGGPIGIQASTSRGNQWRRYTPHQLKTPRSGALELHSNRRRPTPVVKALTSSDVAAKYNKLLDKRLSIAELTEQQLKKNEEFDVRRRQLQLKILEIELQIKEETLKKIKRSLLD